MSSELPLPNIELFMVWLLLDDIFWWSDLVFCTYSVHEPRTNRYEDESSTWPQDNLILFISIIGHVDEDHT